MDIEMTFHQMESTEAIKDYCRNKIGGLEKYYQKIVNARVVMEANKVEHKVQVLIHLPQKAIVKADSEAEDLYQAIDKVVDKLARQLRDYKTQH